MTDRSKPILNITNISKKFGGVTALEEISMAIHRGEKRAIIGPNGAGKTSLFNIISGLSRSDTGRILFADQRIDHLSTWRRAKRGIGRTFQITSLFPQLTVFENIQLALFIQHKQTFDFLAPIKPFWKRGLYQDEADLWLEKVGLYALDDEVSEHLSYGDRKRLELAMVLALRPQVLLLDEPTAGMPIRERQDLMNLVLELTRDQELTLLYTEHHLDIVFKYSDQVAVLHQGRLVAQGEPEEIKNSDIVQNVYLGRSDDKRHTVA